MNIKRSTFYYQVKGNLDKKMEEADIKDKIRDIFCKHPHYGYKRMITQSKREKIRIKSLAGIKNDARIGYPKSNKTKIYLYYQ